MKTPLTVLLTLVLIGSAPFLRAQDDPKRTAAADELLKAMHLEQALASEKENIRKMTGNFLPKDLSPEKLKEVQTAQSAALETALQQLTWDSLKVDFIRIYSEVYTEDELHQLTAFYNSPIGQKFISKMPDLQAKTTEVMQKRMMTIIPAIQQATRDAIAKARASESFTPTPTPTP